MSGRRRPGLTPRIGDEPRDEEKALYLAAIAAFARLAGSDPASATRRASGRLGRERPGAEELRAFSWIRLFEEVESPRLRGRLVSDLLRAHPTGFPWSERELGMVKLIALAWEVSLPDLWGVDWDLVPTPAAELRAARQPARRAVRPRPVRSSFLRLGLAAQAVLACVAIGLLAGWLS